MWLLLLGVLCCLSTTSGDAALTADFERCVADLLPLRGVCIDVEIDPCAIGAAHGHDVGCRVLSQHEAAPGPGEADDHSVALARTAACTASQHAPSCMHGFDIALQNTVYSDALSVMQREAHPIPRLPESTSGRFTLPVVMSAGIVQFASMAVGGSPEMTALSFCNDHHQLKHPLKRRCLQHVTRQLESLKRRKQLGYENSTQYPALFMPVVVDGEDQELVLFEHESTTEAATAFCQTISHEQAQCIASVTDRLDRAVFHLGSKGAIPSNSGGWSEDEMSAHFQAEQRDDEQEAAKERAVREGEIRRQMDTEAEESMPQAVGEEDEEDEEDAGNGDGDVVEIIELA